MNCEGGRNARSSSAVGCIAKKDHRSDEAIHFITASNLRVKLAAVKEDLTKEVRRKVTYKLSFKVRKSWCSTWKGGLTQEVLLQHMLKKEMGHNLHMKLKGVKERHHLLDKHTKGKKKRNKSSCHIQASEHLLLPYKGEKPRIWKDGQVVSRNS